MKKIILLFIPVLIIFSGCKKDKDDEYYVSFTVNGTPKKFTGYPIGSLQESGVVKELYIIGAASALADDDYLGIYMNNYPAFGNFTPGEYTDGSTTFTVLATYENGGFSYEAGQSVAEEAVTHNVTIANHFKVTITHMDDKVMRGTFSGDFYEDGNVQTGTKISIANGQFAVRVEN
ncbi:MAG TPA: hypothetical protein VF476_07125 [Chitinophagaceae bacterium]